MAVSLAQHYGVTVKAVRDIWRGRTWSDVTSESSYKLKKDAARNGRSELVKRRIESQQQVCRGRAGKAAHKIRLTSPTEYDAAVRETPECSTTTDAPPARHVPPVRALSAGDILRRCWMDHAGRNL